MDRDEYRVIITGELVTDADAVAVVTRLSRLLKQPQKTLMAHFGRRPLPLKAAYPLAEAQKIQRYLHRIGAATKLESVIADAPGNGKVEPLNMLAVEQFVGQKSVHYLQQFRKFYRGGQKSFATTWHWPALFVPFHWAVYRKLWGWSLVILFSTVLWPLSNVLWALTANYLYLGHINKRLVKLRNTRSFSANGATVEMVRRAGGTSVFALGVAIVFPAAMGAVAGKAYIDDIREKEALLQEKAAQSRKKEVLLHRDVDMANDQLPEAIVKTAAGRKTYLNMNVLIAGMQMATTREQKIIAPGMGRKQLAKAMHLQPSLFRDGWGKSLSVWIGYEGFSLLSAGPDGEYGNKDDMMMQRNWKSAINENELKK